MKNAIMILALGLAAPSAFASSYKFDCGRTMNIPRLVVITPKAPGDDGYTLAATYSAEGRDETTGTITSKTYKMVGQTDLSSELTGKEIPVIALGQVNNPKFQLVIEKIERVGDTARAAQIDLKTNEVIDLKCLLTSFKK